MVYVKRFLNFWYDFIIGDDWAIAAGVVAGLALTGLLVRRGVDAWWLMPLAVAFLLGISLWREVRQAGKPVLARVMTEREQDRPPMPYRNSNAREKEHTL